MRKIFEDAFMEAQVSMIELCLELTEERVDEIYVYCCMERCEKMFNAFFTRNGKALTVRELDEPVDIKWQFLKLGNKDLAHVEKVCKKYKKPCPTEIRMVFNVITRSLKTEYRYEEYLDANHKSAGHIFNEWIAQVDPTYKI